MEEEKGSRLAEVVKGTCELRDVTANDHWRPPNRLSVWWRYDNALIGGAVAVL